MGVTGHDVVGPSTIALLQQFVQFVPELMYETDDDGEVLDFCGDILLLLLLLLY